MKLTITGKNISLTNALKENVEKKLGKLDKYFGPNIECHVRMGVQKDYHRIEVTIPFNGMILRGEDETLDMYTSIDNVIDKLERQIIKHKTKLEKRHQAGGLKTANIPSLLEPESEFDQLKIVKSKKFPLKPMTVEEAMLEMDLLGHNFFVFTNAETDDVNVIYKRKAGNFGLIEPEV